MADFVITCVVGTSGKASDCKSGVHEDIGGSNPSRRTSIGAARIWRYRNLQNVCAARGIGKPVCLRSRSRKRHSRFESGAAYQIYVGVMHQQTPGSTDPRRSVFNNLGIWFEVRPNNAGARVASVTYGRILSGHNLIGRGQRRQRCRCRIVAGCPLHHECACFPTSVFVMIQTRV